MLVYDHLRGWFKGADTTSLLIYLEHRFADEIAKVSDDVVVYFRKIYNMIVAANAFMKMLFHCGLWLTEFERNALIKSGRIASGLFKECANIAYGMELCRWKLQPKYHLFGEVIVELELDKASGRDSISPLAWSTQMDEDFVGHISIASRSVSIRTLHERTLGRFQISLAQHWGMSSQAQQSL